MRALDRWLGLDVAALVCGLLAAGSVYLAFLGADRAGALMERPPLLALAAVVAAALAATGVRAAARRRFHSALLHAGCALVVGGWLAGRVAVRQAGEANPASGSMAMVDGDESDRLWTGPVLTNYVGRVPFRVKLERFFIEHYPSNQADRDAGRMPPVREYRSRITVTEPGRAPVVANVRVNHPARVRGYHIYQMSWGQSADLYGRPVIYTVLQFIRDPGLPVVYAGFVLVLAGVVLVAVRVMRAGVPPPAGGATGGPPP